MSNKTGKKSDKFCKYCLPWGEENPAISFGMCDTHYTRFRTNPNISLDVLSVPIRHKTKAEEVEKLSASKSPAFSDRVFAMIRGGKRAFTIEEISNQFDVSVGKVREAIEALKKQGKNVRVDDNLTISSPKTLPVGEEETRIDVTKFHGEEIAFGLTADNHLCSKYARLDVLNALYDIWESQGISRVLQAGNMIDGEARFNRYDLLTRPGIDAQAEYLMNEWPVRKGMKTEFVCGDDHEGWYVQREGVNIVDYLNLAAAKSGRDDLKFMGYMEHTYILKGKHGESDMSVIHAGGGATYAHSYTVQKIVESFQPNEKPTILLVGHFHKASFDYPRAVLAVQAGCTQDQTPFLRKRRIEAMVGGWTVSFTVDGNGIVHGFKPQWHPFYDRDFYAKWEYHWKPKGK